MINTVILVGRLTKDPEIRMTHNGTKTCSFSLAVNRAVKKDGQPDADFINCVAWQKTAELMENYLHKGSLIGVEGRIQTRSYENQFKQRVYVTEVVVQSLTFLEPKKQEDNSGYYPDEPTSDPYHANVQSTYVEKPQQRSNNVYPNQTYYQQPSQAYQQPNMVYGTGKVDEGFHSAFDDEPLVLDREGLPF